MKIIYVHGKLVSLGLGGVGSGCNRTLGGTLAVGGAHPPPPALPPFSHAILKNNSHYEDGIHLCETKTLTTKAWALLQSPQQQDVFQHFS